MMKKLLILITLTSCLAFQSGCGPGEDSSVKAAPENVPTSTAEQVGRGRQKAGDESAVGTRGGG